MSTPQPTESQAPLSPRWAFVVQFRVGTAVEAEDMTGRVEHVVSGQAAYFHSPEELLAFMMRMLRTVRTQSREDA